MSAAPGGDAVAAEAARGSIAAPRTTLVSIQYLRAIAALLVVLQHAAGMLPGSLNRLEVFNSGRVGVSIFFVISGLVMHHAARQEPACEFIRRRIVRIVPLYWLLTTVLLAIYLAGYGPDVTKATLFTSYVLSLGFIPHPALIAPHITPLLVPGWTLDREMLFYALFAIGLLIGRPAAFSAAALVALALIGKSGVMTSPIGIVWTDPILLQFAAGLGIGWLLTRGYPAALAALLPVGAVLSAIWASGLSGAAGSVLITSAGAAMIVAGTLALEPRIHRPSRLLMRIGEASYAIYLSHTILMLALMPALGPLADQGLAGFTAAIAIGIAVSSAFGIALHVVLEKPLLAWADAATRRLWRLPPRPRRARETG